MCIVSIILNTLLRALDHQLRSLLPVGLEPQITFITLMPTHTNTHIDNLGAY